MYKHTLSAGIRSFSILLGLTILISMASAGCRTSKVQGTATGSKDTTMNRAVTYTNSIKPMIDEACGTKCHKAAFKAGGVDLSDYEGVRNSAVNGEMIPALQHAEGVKPMPKNGDPFTEEQIALIITWVNAGAPE